MTNITAKGISDPEFMSKFKIYKLNLMKNTGRSSKKTYIPKTNK
jgi:hypothetical protein